MHASLAAAGGGSLRRPSLADLNSRPDLWGRSKPLALGTLDPGPFHTGHSPLSFLDCFLAVTDKEDSALELNLVQVFASKNLLQLP